MADVKQIRLHPLVPRSIPIYGFIYDVRAGKLVEVPEATAIDKVLGSHCVELYQKAPRSGAFHDFLQTELPK